MTITAATLFSGIGAPEVAMPHWRWAWHAEIEKFPSAVMAARHHGSINLGDVTAHDFTQRAEATGRPDVLVFGSPCQDFSVAGKRLGLDGARGNLALTALRIVAQLEPRWFVFENVPGLLSNWSGGPDCPPESGSSIEGVENSDFAAFIGTVDELGYSGAWASLDAQYRGLAQRRNRLFFAGHIGTDWRPSAAVLLEPESLCGSHPPARGAGGRVAHTLTRGADSSGRGGYAGRRQEDDFNLIPVAFGGNRGSGPIDVATALTAHTGAAGRLDFDSETFIVQAFDRRGRDGGAQFEGPHDTVNIRATGGGSSSSYVVEFDGGLWGVRRLTPLEKERCQGFEDGYTLIEWRGKPASDSVRGKALGNSMAVKVIRWILNRIEIFEREVRPAVELDRKVSGESQSSELGCP